jgi:hypothetical protein
MPSGMRWQSRKTRRGSWWQLIGVAVLLLGMVWAVRRSPEPEALVLPQTGPGDFSGQGRSWTPEMERWSRAAQARRVAYQDLVNRLQAEGKIRWHSPASTGSFLPPPQFYWVWVSSGQRVEFDELLPPVEAFFLEAAGP